MLETIDKIKNSKHFIDYQNYHRYNIFGITKVSRREEVHSNFIAWIFNHEANQTFGTFPGINFIKMLYTRFNNIINEKARIDLNLKYNFFMTNYVEKIEVYTEFGVFSSKKRRFDILLHVHLSDGLILPIIIENKVNSKENDEQTVDYYKWGEANYSDASKYHKPFYVFLTPLYNNKPPKQPEFIRITYQDMVDYVLEPTMWWTTDYSKKELIRMYLQALSFQNDNEKGGEIMAVSKEEKKIFEDFVSENKEFMIAVLNSLKDNGSGEGVSPEVVDEIIKSISENDTSKYEFNGKPYPKGRLVLAVVKKYIEDHPGIDYTDLVKDFPDKLQGSYGVVRYKIPDEDLGLKPNKSGKTYIRYFVDSPIDINTPEGIKKAYVCSQWGVRKDGKPGNFDKFLEHVTKTLKYSILKK